MSFNQWNSEISTQLEKTLDERLPAHHFKEVIKYSVLPAGKLFRPLLVYSVAHDLNNFTPGHLQFAQAIELHHTYTLIHDDLPAMDDDDYRRGRLASHKKYSEWEAILAGDALLNLSYELLADLPANKLKQVLRYFAQFNGASGLILGQVYDLNDEKKDIGSILNLHELKTGRLIQLSMLGSAILSDRDDLVPELEALGRAVGLNFQLLDDLCELTEPLNTHEKEINPFVHFNKNELFEIITQNNQKIFEVGQELKLNSTLEYIASYLSLTEKKLSTNLEEVNKQFELTQKDLEQLFHNIS